MRNVVSAAWLVAFLAGGCSGGSGSNGGGSFPPAAPLGAAVQPGDRSVTVTWDAVSGATSYNVYLAADPSLSPGNYAALTEGARRSGAGSPMQVAGLRPAYGYYFVVTAVGAGGESAPSAKVRAVPTGPIPSPASFAASAGDGLALLSWDPVPGASSYTVYWASASGLSATDYLFLPDHGSTFASEARAAVNGLANGREYSFVVTAFVSPDGESGLSAEAPATPEAGAVACETGSALARVVTADVGGRIINPSGATTSISFEYGATTAYGSATTPVQYAIAGEVPHQATLSGLAPATALHYRLVAQSDSGTFHGADRTLRTLEEPAVAVTGLDYPAGLALDAQNLYVTAIVTGVSTVVAKVFAVPLAGGAPVELDASGELSGAGAGTAGQLALAGTDLVWAQCDLGAGTGFVRRVPVAGGGGTSLGSGLACPRWVAADSAFAYWTENGRIARAPLSGATAPAEVAATASAPTGLAVDPLAVYWVEGDELKKAPVAGGAATILAQGLASPERLRLSAGTLYWIEGGSLRRCSAAGGAPETVDVLPALEAFDLDAEAAFTVGSTTALGDVDLWVYRVPLAGGAPEPLSWQAGLSGEIVAGPSSVYWGGAFGPAIYEVPKTF
jgi:hypothetical protein